MSKLNNNKGLTLIELLVVIVLSSLVIIAATSLYIQAVKNKERIFQEASIRDEADYLMSLLVKEFYTLNKSAVNLDMTENKNLKIVKYEVAYTSELASSALNSCVGTKCIVTTGFIEEEGKMKLYIRGKEVKPLNNTLSIATSSTITIPATDSYTNRTPSYSVELTIINTKKKPNDSLTFKNEISLINY